MYVAFLKGTGFTDWLIKKWTHSKYSHCQLVFSDGSSFGSNIFGDMSTQFMNMTYDPAYWDLVEVPMTPEHEREIIKFCQSEQNCKYDWCGIFFSQIFQLGWHSVSKWFCSEFCVAAFQVVGMLPGVQPNRISPEDLHKRIT